MLIKNNPNFQDDVEQFSKIAMVKYSVAKLMKDFKIVDEIKVTDAYGKVDPIHNRIKRTGAIGMEFSGGLPNLIYCCYGQSKIEWAKHHAIAPEAMKDFMAALENQLGLKMVEESYEREGEVGVGARYAVTKLPNSQEKLPATYERESVWLTMEQQLETLRYLDLVSQEVNKNPVIISMRQTMGIGQNKLTKVAISTTGKKNEIGSQIQRNDVL